LPETEDLPPIQVLLDQNVPREVGSWLQRWRSTWGVTHTSEVGLQGKSDAEVFYWAQENDHLIITFDEDFADQRSFPVGQHQGIIRLRVWPTTVEEAVNALSRLLGQVNDLELVGALVIVGRHRIRIRTSRGGN